MGSLNIELINVGDLFTSAKNLRAISTGTKPNRNLGLSGEWRPKIVGDDPETGYQVTVVWYDAVYESKSVSDKRARQLLAWTKAATSSSEK